MAPQQDGALSVTTERRGDSGHVVVTGELDLAGAGELERALEELHQAQLTRVEVDLRGLEFIDSTGLRTLIQAHIRAERTGGRLTLLPGPESVQRVFELTRTVDVLHFRAPD